MCYGCYEDYGCPKPDAKALSVVPLIKAVFDADLTGGSLHIVIEGWNLEDESIERCLELDDMTTTERDCANALLVLNEDQRAAALGQHEGFCNMEANERRDT